MNGTSALALLVGLGAGAISFLSPCVLPLVPGYVAYVSGRRVARGQDNDSRTIAALGLGAAFVAGFSTVFIVLGASATALGRLLLAYKYEANIVAGVIVTLFGSFMIGLVRRPWLLRDFRFQVDLPGGNAISAYVLGLSFAFGWTPCIGPVLGTILTTSAVSATVAEGVALLSAYSLGLGLPFLLSTLLADHIAGRLRRMARLGASLQVGAGGVMIVMGIAMITGQLSAFSFWLLETFPVFQKIG